MAPSTDSGVPETPEVSRRAYVTPELVEWGTVEELTLGSPSGTSDPGGLGGSVT